MYYDDDNRGKIQFPERANQEIDFSGIKYGRITPMDIDGTIEYHNKAFIFYEYKFGNAELPKGQRLAYERLVDKLQGEATVLVCEHNVTDPSVAINGAEALVREIYYHGKWWLQNRKRTARQVTDAFINKVNKDLNNPNNW